MTSPFIPKREVPIKGYPMGQIFGRTPVTGDIGLEIECEGNVFKKQDLPSPWTYHKDNSLRGVDNAEYVLGKPIKFSAVPKAIDDLWTMFHATGTILDESNRTSVHVHLNAQKWHMNRLTAFLGLYFSVEELLTEWCGDHRVGNLFCLRARDATAIITQVKKFIRGDGSYQLQDHLHYAGLNLNALSKFGSLEIRTMRGVNDPQTILDWVSILQRIYELSGDYKNPAEIPGLLSGGGVNNFLEIVLGDRLTLVKSGLDWSQEKIEQSVYDGIRLAQDLCYCRDWSLFEPFDIKDDPFGRPLKKTATALQAFSAAYGAAPAPDTTMAIYNQILGNGGQAQAYMPPPQTGYAPVQPDWAMPVDTEEDFPEPEDWPEPDHYDEDIDN